MKRRPLVTKPISPADQASLDAKGDALLKRLRAERGASDPGDFMFARPNDEGVWCDGDPI